jgi:hypothetical protein
VRSCNCWILSQGTLEREVSPRGPRRQGGYLWRLRPTDRREGGEGKKYMRNPHGASVERIGFLYGATEFMPQGNCFGTDANSDTDHKASNRNNENGRHLTLCQCGNLRSDLRSSRGCLQMDSGSLLILHHGFMWLRRE